jgi:hypothetical protein
MYLIFEKPYFQNSGPRNFLHLPILCIVYDCFTVYKILKDFIESNTKKIQLFLVNF